MNSESPSETRNRRAKKMKDNKECCGNCKYHYRDNEEGEWVRDCRNSDEYTDFTDYSHKCGEWEGRR